MKIISVKKRPWYEIFFSIEEWRVVVEFEDGSRKSYNGWASIHSPDMDTLYEDIRRQVLNDPTNLVGKEL